MSSDRYRRGTNRFAEHYRETDHTFDPQFFAAEDEGRTEDPTEKKKREAVEEGNVPVTIEFPSAMVMGLGLLMVWIFGGWMVYELKQFSIKVMSLQYVDEINQENVHVLIMDMSWIIAKVVAPVAAASYAGAIVANISQTGFIFTLEPLKPDINDILPSGSRLMEKIVFSKRMMWDLGKSVLKIAIVAGVAFEVIYSDFPSLLMLINMGLVEAVMQVVYMAFEIILKAIILLLILSPFDYLFEYYEWYDSIKMTPQEVEDEEKQREGDPQIQERQQERMQEMSERRMMEEVPEADVIITNPTHYAVGLQFKEEQMDAPKITAKGQDMKAQRIKTIAREHGVPVYEVPLLARALYQLELGEEIPPSLYEAVAEVLSWVYQQETDLSDDITASVEQQVKETDFAPRG